jgi:hypothetical protein
LARPVALWLQVHPNPTNKSGLVLNWQVEKESFYDVSIYDIMGRKVRTLRRETMPIGYYNQRMAEGMSAGVYFSVIYRDDDRRVIKFTILR